VEAVRDMPMTAISAMHARFRSFKPAERWRDELWRHWGFVFPR